MTTYIFQLLFICILTSGKSPWLATSKIFLHTKFTIMLRSCISAHRQKLALMAQMEAMNHRYLTYGDPVVLSVSCHLSVWHELLPIVACLPLLSTLPRSGYSSTCEAHLVVACLYQHKCNPSTAPKWQEESCAFERGR